MADKLKMDQIKTWIAAQSGWSYKDKSIRKEYAFSSFRDSIVFVNRIASIADDLDHHPDIDVRYSKVKLTISTHDSGGVTQKDLSLAEKIDFATSAR
ncbi:MAG: 4a-hydroxytetrahydrobiopterin dehydratase [Longimicrobiales bacterium]